MEEVKWSDSLLTGNETIDYQHKTIFNYINDLIKAAREENTLVIEITIDELIKYALHHFRDEEETLKKLNYADFNKHLAQHERFTKQITEFKSQFDQGKNVGEELINYLVSWLTVHIKEEDTKALKSK